MQNDAKNISAAKIVKIISPSIWLEKDFAGDVAVMVGYPDESPFEFAKFNYDYRYTGNANIHAQAEELATSLGAEKPVECRTRAPNILKRSLEEIISEIEEEIKQRQQTLEDLRSAQRSQDASA